MPEVCKWAEVVRHPDVMGGDPCIRGTRVAVETILANLAAGETPEAIQAAFPTLPVGAVEAALSWVEWQMTFSNGWRSSHRRIVRLSELTAEDVAKLTAPVSSGPDDYNLDDLDDDGNMKPKGSE